MILKKKNNKTNGRRRFLTNIISKQKTAIYYVLRHELVTFQYKGDYISIWGKCIHTTNKQTHKLIKADSFLNVFFCNVVPCTGVV